MKVGDIVTVKGIVSNIIPGYESNRIEINDCLVVSENQIVEVIPVSSVSTVIKVEEENVQTENTNPEHSSEDHIQQPEHQGQE